MKCAMFSPTDSEGRSNNSVDQSTARDYGIGYHSRRQFNPVQCKICTLLLDLPSESVGGKPCAFHILCHCPLTIQANVPTAGNFSLKQRVKTSKLVNFSLKF